MGNRLVFLHWGNRLVFLHWSSPIVLLHWGNRLVFLHSADSPRNRFQVSIYEDDVWPNALLSISVQDKENVLRQAKLLKGQGISITEDISNKAYISGSTHFIFSTETNQRIFRSSEKRRRHFVSHKNQY
jgi:hypothetical protein